MPTNWKAFYISRPLRFFRSSDPRLLQPPSFKPRTGVLTDSTMWTSVFQLLSIIASTVQGSKVVKNATVSDPEIDISYMIFSLAMEDEEQRLTDPLT